MLMTRSQSQPSSPSGRGPLQQIYVTHCLHDEGVYRQAGFTVRAASTLDPLLLRFALEYPAYEAPAGDGGEAPRRLALVRIPGGQSALIHSVSLPGDERGRANNFFSHVVVGPKLGAREALRTWASPGWRAGCRPEVATDLPPLDELPESAALDDRAVTAFLRPGAADPEDGPATTTCPGRLAGDVKRRRELVALALRGCLRALQAGPAAARGRFYLLAEPGLTALLLYAAARLLPDALADALTFSTYENARRDLRTYKHARVVGTCTADPERGLEPEFFTSRGYALDTFEHRFSPELEADGDRAVEEWVELAARGDWASIDKVHRLLGKTRTALVPVQEAVQAARVSRHLASGRPTPDDLIALKTTSWGPAVLGEHADRVWPLVRERSLADARVRDAYADELTAHLPELEQRAATALAADPPGDWRPHWRLLAAVLHDDPARLRETLQRLLPEPPYVAGLRLALLAEFHRGQLSPVDPRQPAHALLRNCSAEELGQFPAAGLPAEWFARALVYALARPETRTDAIRLIHAGDDELVKAFWDQFRLVNDEGQRRLLLAHLLPADAPEGGRFLHRLLVLRQAMRPETLEWLLKSFKAFSRDGAEFWGRDNHLGLLLDLLRGLGEAAAPLWDRLCGLIDREVLLSGDVQQNTVLRELAAARDRPGPALPRRTVQVIDDWILLRDHFEKATDVPESGRRAVIDACNRLRFDSVEALGRYFARYVLPQGVKRAVLDDFVGFFHSFFLAGMEHQSYSSRLIAWLQVVSACPDEALRADYQRYYLENHVPVEFRWRLAEEAHEGGRLSPAVFEAVKSMRPEKPAPTATPVDELFQLGGVRAAGEPSTFGASLRGQLPWLVCSAVGGLLAAALANVYRVQFQRVAPLVLFVPVVLALAETVALRSVALAVRALREPALTGAGFARRLVRELLGGFLLGVVGGLLVGVAAGVWTRSAPLALAAGGALVLGLTASSAIGGGVPWLLRRLRCDGRVAAGPVARTLADLLALFLYLGLSCLLVR